MSQGLVRFAEARVMGILRGAETGALREAVAAVVRGGLRTIEITLNRPEALDQIAAIHADYGSEIDLGAGTVLDVASAERAVAAGARFIVSPAVIPEVIDFCTRHALPVFPGAMTPTEVLAAHRAGAEMVKVFPASVLGPAYIHSLKGPFPDVRLMPTGGVTVQNLPGYFRAGADAVAVGGELFRPEWMGSRDWDAIERMAREYREAATGARS